MQRALASAVRTGDQRGMKRIFALLLLTGCAATQPLPESPISPISAATGDACQSGRYEYLTNNPATDLERVLILGQVRVIRPGQPVTRDLRPERLNFEVDRQGTIARVFCG